ncbi:GTPase HflX [Stygiobacter electus]|uniref:GTPase HflX n=1 Tax=Stygiobacter electus TaxID=3032292 RepID=A0AAE3TDR4_9BACT|nr:GTPase HflX [Stygiobacter electus]MDF1611687.1 GTPase HflX [Stygiobacter electus]
MIELKPIPKERAILIALSTGEFTKGQIEEHLDELELLTDTAGAETVFKVLQEKSKPDPAYFIGKGKAEEIAQLIELNNIQLVIFDDDLNPTQVRNLEKLFERKILDRSGLILDIFASHAKTREAKTQIELAQLQYLLPRLTRAWTHLSKQYGGIGTKGPGETQIETDRRIIRARISKLKENLKKIESQQLTKSSGRKDFITATLVGYTNAGKSTLMNRLTNSDLLAEDKLFATLDSTTRALTLAKGKNILVSDTVGFIRKLPHHLVASFKSTLNVVKDADIILHVIDISNEYFEEHIKVVDDTLEELNSQKKTQIKIFNKVDNLKDKSKIDFVTQNFPESIIISAERGININNLKNILLNLYEKYFVEEEIFIPHEKSKVISMIHELSDVIQIKYHDETTQIKYRTSAVNNNLIKKILIEEKVLEQK